MSDVETMALLPCPFCGGDAYVWSECRVICGKCDCEGPECGDDDALQKNIPAWNRRAIPPHYLRAVEEREGLIEALEAYEREREDMEDRAPTYPECIECNLGTGPHKRTCAHHLARAILSRAQAPTPVAGEGETK